ncbi:Tetratricopeptide-like helical domain-containing protein [Dioscorea alata]|uniref:Tetratricopeptide-like helical domain-containing protein n=1 Tax=Dioscorea alata TaxID=55571 RepID=A0ACB7UNL2_DIOAL|nr:Tetratricopeptide-like helical domain-containing protein [Dioscorea alata]
MLARVFRAASPCLNGSILLYRHYHSPFIAIRERFREGDHLGTISLFIQMRRERTLNSERPLFLLLLKSSLALSWYRLGISLHAHILKLDLQNDVFISTALVDMLCKFSCLGPARKVFDEMPERDVAAWNAMLAGYAKHGYVDQAMFLFRDMRCCGVELNALTLSVLLQVCCGCAHVGKLWLGKCIHAYVYRRVLLADIFLCNSLLVYYNHCDSLCASERFFESMGARDVVSWNAMMCGYIRNGFAWRALEAFQLLRVEEGLAPDLVSVETALQACAQIGEEAIFGGEMVHALLFKFGFPMDVYVENCLLHMYCKCGKIETARYLFDIMETRNIVSSNIIVHGYVQINEPKKAIAVIQQLRFVEAQISCDVIVDALQAVKLLPSRLECVLCMHCLIIKMGYGSDEFVSSSLIGVYGDHEEAELARKCLDDVGEQKNATVCYNTMLSVYLHQDYFSEVLELLRLMCHNDCKIDSVTLVNAVSACARCLDLNLGRVMHAYILRNGFDSDVYVATSLIELYSKCGHLSFACWLFSKMSFRNIVSWNSLIHGCVENGFPRVSLKLFFFMQLQDGLMPDSTSVVGAVESIGLRGYENERNYIHNFAIQSGLVSDEYVANALISMHARFCEFEKARLVFDRACKDRTVIWNTFMSEYTFHGMLDDAVSVFSLMKHEKISPDLVTILCLLRICAFLGSLSCTSVLHAFICKNGYDSDAHVETSLLDVYAKCGDLHIARLLFDKMNSKTVVSWNSMIQAYGIHGNVEEASNLFSQLQQSGILPTIVTFLILISGCSHAGDAEKGRQYIDLMTQAYSLSPGREHFSSFIDLLGRRGLIKEAYEFLENLPVNPGVSAWGALFGACRAEGNLKVGLAAAEKVFDMDPLHCGYNSLLSNMFMEAGRCIDAFRIRRKVESMQVKKVQGYSMIESIY